ncbi:hypothetical protein GCM10023170_072470 [Phytohabitans houttuyneae]
MRNALRRLAVALLVHRMHAGSPARLVPIAVAGFAGAPEPFCRLGFGQVSAWLGGPVGPPLRAAQVDASGGDPVPLVCAMCRALSRRQADASCTDVAATWLGHW